MLSTLNLYGRKTPLTIYGPEPLGEILEYHLRYFDQNLGYDVEWIKVDTTEHKLIFENRTLEVWSVPLRHRLPTSGYLFREKEPQLNIEKYKIEKYNLTVAQIAAAKRGEDIVLDSGELIANSELTYLPYPARSYAYLSDTNYSAKAASLCRGVDLLYHETTYMDDEHHTAKERGHSTTIDAARAATIAEAKQLIIGHFSSRYKDLEPLLAECRTQFINTELALEGCRFDIPENRRGR